MAEMKSYPVEFIQRTHELLAENFHDFEKEDKEATFLMNCLLGLIITLSENENKRLEVFKGRIDDGFLDLVPDKIGFVEKMRVDDTVDLTDKKLTGLDVSVGHKADLKRMDKFWFINKIRNTIAHQHVESVNREGKWVGVRLSNKPSKNIKDFEVLFTIEQLRTFALGLSNRYLQQTGQICREREQGECVFSNGTTERSNLDR